MNRSRLLTALALLGLSALLWWTSAGAAGPPDPASRAPTPSPTPFVLPIGADRLHPALRRTLAASQPDTFYHIIIEWRTDASARLPTSTAPDRLARRQQVVAALQADAERQSAPLRAALADAVGAGLARDVRPFWISPVIALEAQSALIVALAARDDVVQVRLDAPIYLQDPPLSLTSAPQGAAATSWNLAMIRADLADAALGLDGTGVVVANLDTGVDWQHPALLTHYRGYRGQAPAVHFGNWHVSTDESYLYPGDGNGHGTHTMGIMVGDDGAGNRVGVAPGARWMAVKLFANDGHTEESWVHDAFQWVIAPEGDPALAPDIVNNSWGSDASADTRFLDDIIALRAADILPVFSAGNAGPGEGTIDSPGSYGETVAVGAVDQDKMLASFSGRGPSPWDAIKPDVVAPGVNVLSTYPGGGWALGTGTSMAAPHVAGLAALLRQAGPGLSVDQIDAILNGTARPQGAEVPNNDTGWGLVDAYAAGLRVTAHGELVGRVVRGDGAGIPAAAIVATAHDQVHTTVTSVADSTGVFTVALRAGLYDLVVQAFGFEAGAANGLRLEEGVRTMVTVTLAALPAGSVFGRITDSQTGAPLSATVTVDGTPVSAEADPSTGLYSLALPSGAWRLRVAARAHRIGREPVTVTVGVGQALDIALPPAPTILLVDSGRWYYQSQSSYFTDALEALDYPFDFWPIRDLYGDAGVPGQRPKLDTLRAHDVVVWSAPLDSPALVNVASDLSTYLRGGGRLLISGQDVAYLDGGGSIFDPPASYFVNDLGLIWAGEGELGDLAGLPGPLSGITLTLNAPDSARDQEHPDNVILRDAVLSSPALVWPDAAIGGALAGVCRSYRAAWLGFGLEGAGPRSARIETLGRVLNWFVSPAAPYGLLARGPDAPLIGRSGSQISGTVGLDTTGVVTDTVDLYVASSPWPLVLTLPDGATTAGNASFTLPPCTSAAITASIAIPPDVAADARAAYTLTFRSRGDPTVTQTVNLTAKTPAPILLVNGQRWYDHTASYTATLDALALTYDLFDTLGGITPPPTDTLTNYPLILWVTGYNWYNPLGPAVESRLAAFLDGGGRLLLTGQDILDTTGVDPFVRDRLGVMGAALTVTTTDVLSLPDSPLGSDLGPWRLTYPYLNWSDAVLPRSGAHGTLQDEHLFTVGVVNAAQTWRTAFFPFSLETLDDDARATLVGRTLLWLSPLGNSRLEAPAFVAAGGRVPITLTLGLATDAPAAGLRARLPLPLGVTPAEGGIRGPWSYDAGQRTLVWTGSLAPDARLTLGADLMLAADLPAGSRLPLRADLHVGDNLTVTADAPVFVDVPWLTLGEQAQPPHSSPGGSVQYTLTVQNVGLLPTTAHLTDTLPSGMLLADGSAWASRGTATPGQTRLLWSDVLEPGAQARIGFTGVISTTHLGDRLIDRTELTDDRGHRVVAWAVASVEEWCYLPLISK